MAKQKRNNLATSFAVAQVAHTVDLLRYAEGVRERIEHHLQDLAEALVHCDAVVVLPGWEASEGSMAEVQLAREAGKPVTPA